MDKKIFEILDNVDPQFIKHYKTASWGASIMFMKNDGKAYARMYWYNDDSTTIYLDTLSVYPEIRQMGIGTMLQEIREKIGIELGMEYVCLWVKKDSWMYNWYRRRGYEYLKDYEGQENSVWMKKKLK